MYAIVLADAKAKNLPPKGCLEIIRLLTVHKRVLLQSAPKASSRLASQEHHHPQAIPRRTGKRMRLFRFIGPLCTPSTVAGLDRIHRAATEASPMVIDVSQYG